MPRHVELGHRCDLISIFLLLHHMTTYRNVADRADSISCIAPRSCSDYITECQYGMARDADE